MTPSTIRRAIGAVKDQTSISLAKVAGNVAPDLEVLVVKATSHDDEPCDEKYTREIIHLTSQSRGYVNAFVYAISKRLSKTHDWIVALKALILVHRALNDGDPFLGHEIVYGSRKGTRVLNMSDFRDEAHSNSWDHCTFVRAYALYLDQKLEFTVYQMKLNGGDGRGEMIGEMNSERILERLNHLLKILDLLLVCRPIGLAKNSRMVLTALNLVLKESFSLYVDLCEVLEVLQIRFSEMCYADCVIAFDEYVNSAKMMDKLEVFYSFCKALPKCRLSGYPEVKKIPCNLLETLEGFVRQNATNKQKIILEESIIGKYDNTIEIKALPAPETTPVPPPPPPPPLPRPSAIPPPEDLVNLRKDSSSASEHTNKLELALFSKTVTNREGSWEAFTPEEQVVVKSSAWPELGKADWELALVESTSNLSNQNPEMGGGLDPLILNGMYDQGTVNRHKSSTQLSSGSSSSTTLPGTGAIRVLALPAPDGTLRSVGHEDPFQASLSVPPPSYVQIADMEKKQHLLVQEQQLWQQYGSNGMQGQVGLAKIAGVGFYGPVSQSYYAPPF